MRVTIYLMETLLYYIKKLIPNTLFNSAAPIYHYMMAFFSALFYRFPSREIKVIAVTGTKGKTTTVELINAILEEAGFKTALSGTLRFKIGNESRDNLYKMSMPGRFLLQRFLRNAVNKKCDYVIMEMTSQGVTQFRHTFIDTDALLFTNLSPEHIESHGSYEKYRDAKLQIAKRLEKSSKTKKILVVNGDDKESQHFLKHDITEKYSYSLNDAKPFEFKDQGIEFTFDGITMHSQLTGEFNLYNVLGAATLTKFLGIPTNTIKRAVEKFTGVRGRVERINLGQNFDVIVDYAHTPDSLTQLYKAFKKSSKICVLGNTGGGRDKWKRKEMAQIADAHCSTIILTNEDPYDEDPRAIVAEMKEAITQRDTHIIMDRREAIYNALKKATKGDTVLITGKGTDPYIMGPNNTKIPWSDASVVKEELKKIVNKN